MHILLNELSSFEYLAGCANPKLYADREVTPKAIRTQFEKLPLATVPRRPAADGALAKCPKKDDAALNDAMSHVWRARETLHHSLFEAATHSREVAEVYNRCLPKSGAALNCLDGIMAQVDDTAQSASPQDTLQTAYDAMAFAEKSLNRTSVKKIDPKTKKKLLEEINSMRQTLSCLEDRGQLNYATDVQNQLMGLHMRACLQMQNADQTDFVAKLACLIHACHEQAILFSKNLAGISNIPVWPLTRIILGSALYSYHDSCIAESFSLKNSVAESARRAAHASAVLQTKFLKMHNGSSKISTHLLKKLASLSLDASGQAIFSAAMPASWQQDQLHPRDCANVWLMHCGISAAGALLPGFNAPILALQQTT